MNRSSARILHPGPADLVGEAGRPVTPPDARTVALVAVALVVVVFALRLGAAFFIPLLVSLFSSYALTPVVSRLERWHVPRAFGAALTMLLVIAALGFGVERAITGASDVLEELPRGVQKLRYAVASWERDARGPLKQVRKTADELQKLAGAATASEPAAGARAAASAPAPAPAAATDAGSLLALGTAGMTIVLSQLVSVLFLTFFLLAAGDLFRRKLVSATGPSLTRRKKTLQILRDIHQVSQRYFALVLAINLAVGLLTGMGLYLLDIRHPAFWGVAMAVLHTIPYLGAAAVTAAAGLSAYLQFGSLGMALAAAAVPLAAALAIGLWLQTALLGRTAKMNAVVVFVALLFWGMIWGGWGLLLAFPIMASVKIVCSEIVRLKPIASLMNQ
jgi:predicted PurR-regulated permease PerM